MNKRYDEPVISLEKPVVTNISGAVLQKYYPSLNGFRALSIILVVMSHLELSLNIFYMILFNGQLGVNVFFVLSGFLITSLCLKEKQKTGTLSLKNFYIRRALRILPVVYLYLVVVLILDQVFHTHIRYVQYLGILFFVSNFNYFITHGFRIELSQFWSLAVEEQFYILFPFILKKSYRFFLGSIIFLIVVLPMLCVLNEFWRPLSHGLLYYFTHFFIKFQSIAIGCLLSLLAFRKILDREWIWRYKSIVNLAAIIFIFFLHYDHFYSLKNIFTNLIISLLTGYVIMSNLVPSKNLFFQFLNWKPLSFIGILSYSVYVWHPLMTGKEPNLPSFMFTFPFNIILIVVIPLLSYFFYEKYFLKLKTKFSRL